MNLNTKWYRNISKQILLTFFINAIVSVSGWAADFYASPAGLPTNQGSINSPWDLQTALKENTKAENKNSVVKPGDVIWLMGGTYGTGAETMFGSYLVGTESRPIVVRQRLGERAIVDGSISAYGAWTTFWGFEITNSNVIRKNQANDRPGGLNFYTPGHKAINLIVHDVGHPGIGIWTSSKPGAPGSINAEVYGTIFWGNGLYDLSDPRFPDGWTRGAGIYAQNKEGFALLDENIFFKNFTEGLKIYSQGGYANGFIVKGNVVFSNQTTQFLATDTNNPIESLILSDNYTYMDENNDNSPSQIGYASDGDIDQVSAEIRNNYFVQGQNIAGAFQIYKWKNITMDNNTFVSQKKSNFNSLVNLFYPVSVISLWMPTTKENYIWQNNHYYGGGGDSNTIKNYGAEPVPFMLRTVVPRHDELLALSQWNSKVGLTAVNDTYSADLPSQNAIFVRPNKYETGRAHLVIYNWENKDSVSVDISAAGLSMGDAFEVRDVQNYYGTPILSSTYKGTPISLPLNLTATTPLVGAENITHFDPTFRTDKKFNVFVLVKTGPPQDTQAPTVPTNLTANAVSSNQVNLSWGESTDNTGVVGYKIFRNNDPTPIATITQSHYEDRGLLSGTDYQYTLLAYDSANNESALTSIVRAQTLPPTTGNNFFVAPHGSNLGDGSFLNPWDLSTALADNSKTTNKNFVVKPGDTIWLRGGIYAGGFVSSLSGTASAPIIVRAYPNEQVVVNDSFQTLLLTDLPANGGACIFQDGSRMAEGGQIQIGADQIYVYNRLSNSSHNPADDNTYTCLSGWNGTTAAPHPKNSQVELIGSIIEHQGSYVWFWGFEITSVRQVRSTSPLYLGPGLNLSSSGQGNKAINLIIHDVGHPAIGFWGQSDGGEVNGCILWGNGLYDNTNPDQPNGWTRGDGIYAQNDSGSVSIRDVIAFKNFTTGIKAFGEGGKANGFALHRNVVFFNKSNILAGTSIEPIERLTITQNLLYNDPSILTTGLRVGYVALNNKDVDVSDNYIVAGKWNLTVSEFSMATVRGNTFVDGINDEILLVNRTGGFPAFNYNWNMNSYFSGGGSSRFSQSASFSDWKTATGYDASGAQALSYPTENKIIVYPNMYEPGRAHIVVYNWERKNIVNVDISAAGLVAGDHFQIMDVQNISGAPLIEGSYVSSSISLPVNLTEITPTLGFTHYDPNIHTPKEFNVFLLRKVSGVAMEQDTVLPTIPTGLLAKPVSSTQINLSWMASTDNRGIAGYKVYRNSSLLATVHSVTFNDVGLTASTAYTYVVSAMDAARNDSGFSQPVTAITLAIPVAEASSQSTVSNTVFNPTRGEKIVVGAFLNGEQGTITILNRQGQIIQSFQEADPLTTWDGRNQKGDLVGSGVYLVKFPKGQKRIVVLK